MRSMRSGNSSTSLRREHGWWDRYDADDFGTHANDAQWELVTTSITESQRTSSTSHNETRAPREEALDADV